MSVTEAKGFAASGVSAGIRPSGKPDVALVRSLTPAVGCAMWTRNRVQAAPVVVSRRHLEAAEPQAVVVNAGVANAATGRAGEEDAVATAVHTARLLGLATEEVVVLSTGVIGPRLPMEKIVSGVDEAAATLSPGGGPAASEAILTTDAGPKTSVARGDGFVVGGMAKGAGMIHPALATMLAVVTTDFPLGAGRGRRLSPAGCRGDLQPHLGRRRLLDERRGRPPGERPVGRHTRRGARRAVRGRAAQTSAPTSRARSSPTAKERRSSWRSGYRARARRPRRRRSRSGSRRRRS